MVGSRISSSISSRGNPVEQRQNKDVHRQQTNQSEREWLLPLYKESLWTVTGHERKASRTLH